MIYKIIKVLVFWGIQAFVSVLVKPAALRAIGVDSSYASIPIKDILGSSMPASGFSGGSKNYPLQILSWHEMMNERLGAVPIADTFLAFDRRMLLEESKRLSSSFKPETRTYGGFQ